MRRALCSDYASQVRAAAMVGTPDVIAAWAVATVFIAGLASVC